LEYISTRGGMPPQPFSAILLEGLAPDGGLMVPEHPNRARARTTVRSGIAAWPSRCCRCSPTIFRPRAEALIDRTYTAATFGSDGSRRC
jgi:threonine synthase